MPPKRRSTASRTAGLQRAPSQQQTLSFHGQNNAANRVTKRRSSRAVKSIKKDPALLKDVVASDSQDVKDEEGEAEVDEVITAEQAIEQQIEEEAEAEAEAEAETFDTVAPQASDVRDDRAEPSPAGATGGADHSGWLGDEEVRARTTPSKQIRRYWAAKEQERKAPRLHQEELGVHEKILREWDMQNLYGPCIGVARLKRWKRANKLGLEPPIEVLAVLLKEMDGGVVKSQRAHVDELMSSRFVET